MSSLLYACTHIEKRAEVDNFETGCDPDTGTTVMFEAIDIKAASLKELIDRIGTTYGLAMDDLFIPDEDGLVGTIGFNRLETEDGSEPSPADERKWKKHKTTLYLADYHFAIEKRLVSDVHLDEFEAAGLKCH